MNIVWTWDVVRRIIEVLWLINIAFAVWTVFRSRRDIASTWAWLLVFKMNKNNYGLNILKSNEN